MTPSVVGDRLRRILQHARDTSAGFVAAGIAYYGLVALFPSLLLAFAALVALEGQVVVERVVAAADGVLSATGRQYLHQAVRSATGRWETPTASAMLLAWSSGRLVRGLTLAFRRIYDVAGDPSLGRQLRDGTLALAGVTLAAAAVVTTGAVLDRVLGTGTWPLRVGVQMLTITAVLFPLYSVLPAADTGIREVLPGTVVTAVGWTALGAGARTSVRLAARNPIYGVFGGTFLLVTLLYVASLVLVGGAVVNVVLAGRD